MRILHVSDSHGISPGAPVAADVIVHSGDFAPSFSRGNRRTEPRAQERWFVANLGDLAAWIGDRPFLFMPGNHDFFDPCHLLRAVGIAAHNLWEQGPKVIGGYRFAGIPHVPTFTSEWNYEVPEQEIAYRIAECLDVSPDVLVCHSPPKGILDLVPRGEHIGSAAIRDALARAQRPPLAYLCGHCHEGEGVLALDRTLYSNAATTQRIVELP